MRSCLFLVVGALFGASSVLAQPSSIPAWYQITSNRGTEVVQARLIQTHTSRSGETRVKVDGTQIRTDGPVLIIPLGTGNVKPQPQSGTTNKGLISSVVIRPGPRFRMYSFDVKVEGKNVVRMLDTTTQTQTSTSTSTNSDGSTSTETTTEEGGGEEEGGEEEQD